MSDSKNFSDNAHFSQTSKKRTDAISNYMSWECYPSQHTEENGHVFWPYPIQPKYDVRHYATGRDIFDAVVMNGWPRFSNSHIVLNAGMGDSYEPILCAKNLGARNGVGAFFSYGPRANSIITELLNGGKAMDYKRKSAKVEFYLFHGSVEIEIKDIHSNSFQNHLQSAGKEMVSFFASFIPYSKILGSSEIIFTAIDSAKEEGNPISAGEAVVGSYWSRINPDGSGEIGKTINNPMRQSAGNWSVQKDVEVNVGQFFAIYTDISTRFQQQKQDAGSGGSPDLWAKLNMRPDADEQQTYYKIRGINPPINPPQ